MAHAKVTTTVCLQGVTKNKKRWLEHWNVNWKLFQPVNMSKCLKNTAVGRWTNTIVGRYVTVRPLPQSPLRCFLLFFFHEGNLPGCCDVGLCRRISCEFSAERAISNRVSQRFLLSYVWIVRSLNLSPAKLAGILPLLSRMAGKAWARKNFQTM